MRYLTSVDGGSPNRVFRNPNGDLYEIITLSDCEGLQDPSPDEHCTPWALHQALDEHCRISSVSLVIQGNCCLHEG